MIDLGSIAGFQWDAGNVRKSADKHGVSQSEAEQVFFNEPLLLIEHPRHSAQEPRFHALGKMDDARLLLIVFTLRVGGTLVRVISARDMNRRERGYYDEA
jgi:uncharacterized DUF497 family protein